MAAPAGERINAPFRLPELGAVGHLLLDRQGELVLELGVLDGIDKGVGPSHQRYFQPPRGRSKLAINHDANLELDLVGEPEHRGHVTAPIGSSTR